jgi:hypothetical protein
MHLHPDRKWSSTAYHPEQTNICSWTPRRLSPGLVLRGFKSLVRDHGPSSFPYESSILTLETIERKRDHLDRLRLNLLPLLEHQLITLSQLLEPTHLRKEPEFTFNFILGVQAQLVQTFDQIRIALRILCPEPPEDVESNRLNDQHFREFKVFRVRGLHRMIIEEVLPELNKLFRCSYHLINGTHMRSSLESKRIILFTSS